MKLYDAFQEDCRLALRKIKEAKTTEDQIKASLELAKLKVDYYEQHANVDGIKKNKEYFASQLKDALWEYQAVLDRAYDAGVCVEHLTYAGMKNSNCSM